MGRGDKPGWPVPLALADWRLPFRGAEAVRFAAWCGIDAVQLNFGGPGQGPGLDDFRRQDDIAEACAAHGVSVIAVAGNLLNDIGLSAPMDSPTGAAARKAITGTLDAAYRLGAPLAFFPSFRKGLIRGDDALDRTAEMLRWACAEAAKRSIAVANENDLGAGPARRLIEQVGHPRFRLVLDSYNPVRAGHRAVDLVAALGKHFAPQVHVKDGIAGQDGSVPLGDGDGDLRQTLAVLSSRDIAERYVLENDYRHGDPRRLVRDLDWLAKAATLTPSDKFQEQPA